MSNYLDAFTGAGLTVLDVREETFDFLSAYHDVVLGWVGGTEKIDGEPPTSEAVDDRSRLMGYAMDTLFGGRPHFNACWTYITCTKKE